MPNPVWPKTIKDIDSILRIFLKQLSIKMQDQANFQQFETNIAQQWTYKDYQNVKTQHSQEITFTNFMQKINKA